METAQRPEYRDAKTPRAVRVYTIAQESRYIVFENVPALGLVENLLKQCATFGPIEAHRVLDSTPQPEFTESVWVKFCTWRAARMAKLAMDDKPFYSNLLRASYAPEYETVEDARTKLQEHHQAVMRPPRKRQHHRLGRVASKQEPPQANLQVLPTVSADITPTSANAGAGIAATPSLGTQPKRRRRI